MVGAVRGPSFGPKSQFSSFSGVPGKAHHPTLSYSLDLLKALPAAAKCSQLTAVVFGDDGTREVVDFPGTTASLDPQ